jgi:hypothetical protein
MDGPVDERSSLPVDGRSSVPADGWMDQWTGGYVDQWMVDQCASGWAEQCANGWMDQRICSAPTSGDLQAGSLQTVISKQAKRWSLTFVTS